MRQYRLSQEAQDDLNDIAKFIIEDNPDRAVTFVEELRSRFKVIAERPASFPARESIAPGLRSAVYGKYLILFRIEMDFVRILRVIHGARDIPALFSEK